MYGDNYAAKENLILFLTELRELKKEKDSSQYIKWDQTLVIGHS